LQPTNINGYANLRNLSVAIFFAKVVGNWVKQATSHFKYRYIHVPNLTVYCRQYGTCMNCWQCFIVIYI